MEVLSLAKRIAELERVEAVRKTLLGYCARGVHASARTLVRFDETRVAELQDLLHLEATRISGAETEDELRSSYERLDLILEEHRAASESRLRSLRENLDSTSRVLHTVLHQITGSGAAHHDSLERDIERLKEIAWIEEIEALKRALQETAAHLADQLQSMRREHQLIVSQLRDEIRILHQELQERTQGEAAAASPATPSHHDVPPPRADQAPEETFLGMKRPEFVEVLKVKTDQGESYSLAVILLSNLAELFAKHEPAAVLALMDAAARRVVDAFAGNPFWMRWEEDCFLVCTHYRGTAASSWACSVAERVSGPQRVRTANGISELTLTVAAASIDSQPAEAPETILQRVSDLILHLRSAA